MKCHLVVNSSIFILRKILIKKLGESGTFLASPEQYWLLRRPYNAYPDKARGALSSPNGAPAWKHLLVSLCVNGPRPGPTMPAVGRPGTASGVRGYRRLSA